MGKFVLVLSLGRTGSMPIFGKFIVSNFSNDFCYDIMVSNSSDTTIEENTISIKTYTSGISFIFNTLFLLPYYLLKVLFKINRYHTLYLPYHHFWDIPFILLFRIFNKKVVFTVHDGILHQGEDGFMLKLMHNCRLKYSSHFIFLTKFVMNSVPEKYRRGKEIKIIPHGLITNSYWKPSTKSNKNLLFLGRISKYKGVELLIESIKEVEADFTKLIIAGKSNYKLEGANHPKIEILNKYLSEKEIGDLLIWADILILPYIEATQSGVIALGINAEVAMICTKVGGFSEQLNDDECLWVSPDKKSLTNGINTLVTNQDLCKAYQRKMKIKKEDLSWSKIGRETQVFIN